MSNFSTWWESLSFALKVYWGLAVPFTLFFLLQLVISFFGGDDGMDHPDVDVDTSIETDHGAPFQFLTLKNLIAFFTIFGWTGIGCIDSGMSEMASLIVAVVAGLSMALIMATIFYFLGKADASGTMVLSRAIGESGEVYLTITAARGNIGKVQIKVQGALRTLDAITDDGEDISTGKIIFVKDIVNNILLVSANKA